MYDINNYPFCLVNKAGERISYAQLAVRLAVLGAVALGMFALLVANMILLLCM